MLLRGGEKPLGLYISMNESVLVGVFETTHHLEHVIDVLWWNGHTVILDVEKAMGRSCVQYLLSDCLGWPGDVDDWYGALVVFGRRHIE